MIIEMLKLVQHLNGEIIMKKVVTIGGGTGQFVLLSALKNLDIDLTAIVSMVDNGGSTGQLRDEYGVLPPGDILKCLIALSPYREAREILQTRFEDNEKLAKHNAGNLLLTFMSQYLSGDFPEAVKAFSRILKVKGTVLPVTIDKATLAAELEDGQFIFGETVIDIVKQDSRARIARTFLVPHSVALFVYPPVTEFILAADYIIIGPGDIYTSITPNFLVPGVKEAIQETKAKVIYISNIMTKYGETSGLSGSQIVAVVETYLGRQVDIILANNEVVTDELRQKYQSEKADAVNFDNNKEDKRILFADLLSDGPLARHDVEKLQAALAKQLI